MKILRKNIGCNIRMNFYLQGRILYILRELQKRKTLSLKCPNIRHYLKLINLMLDRSLLKIVKYGYIVERGQTFPLVVGVSKKGIELLKNECDLNG